MITLHITPQTLMKRSSETTSPSSSPPPAKAPATATATATASTTTQNHERFLATMTFANVGEVCDCDECGPLSFEISSAVAQHKRQKMLQNDHFAKTIVQERSLIIREDGLSIWKLLLPPRGAEPLTEYGNSHRIVFVERLPNNRVVKSVGRGIIGSSNEAKSRMEEVWEERCAYLYPSNGGKAIGWVNDKLESDKHLNVNDVTNDVVLYVVKVTHDLLQRMEKKELKFVQEGSKENVHKIDELPKWVEEVLCIFDKTLTASAATTSSSRKNNTSKRFDISTHDSTRIRIIIDPFIKNKATDKMSIN